MDVTDYGLYYAEALAKANLARASSVRQAYLDLADFYRQKLDAAVRSTDRNTQLGQHIVPQREAA